MTTTTDQQPPTVADIICDQFGHGQCFERTVVDEKTGEETTEYALDAFDDFALYIKEQGNAVKYIMRDGSSVVVVDGLAYAPGFQNCDCFCWEEAGHHDDCIAAS